MLKVFAITFYFQSYNYNKRKSKHNIQFPDKKICILNEVNLPYFGKLLGCDCSVSYQLQQDFCIKKNCSQSIISIGDGFAGVISQLNIIDGKNLSASIVEQERCFNNKDAKGQITWFDFAYSTMEHSYVDIPSRCDGRLFM